MPWTTRCSEWNWPVQRRSLLCCLGRPRAAKTAFMARSGGGISRLLPHSQGEWTRCHGCPISNEANIACTDDDGDDPHEADSEREARPQTPGTAWCGGRCPTQGRSLCCHTVRRRREEGKSPSPDQSAADKRSCRPARRPDRLPKQPHIQMETTEEKP